MNNFPTNGPNQMPFPAAWGVPFNGFQSPFPFPVPQNFNPYWNQQQAFWNPWNSAPNFIPNFTPNFGWGFQGQFPTPYGMPVQQTNPWLAYAAFNSYQQQFNPWGGNAYAATFPFQGNTANGFSNTGVSPGFFPGYTQGQPGQQTGYPVGGFGGFGYPTNGNTNTPTPAYANNPYAQGNQGNYNASQQTPLNNLPWVQPNYNVPTNSNGYFNTQQFQFQTNPFQPVNGATPQNGAGEPQEAASKRNGVSR